jgi:hypothetical protein
MTPGRPSLDEIEATVSRLEERLAASRRPDVLALLASYRELDRRFRADLADRRDLALSRGAVLMLLKHLDEQSGAKGTPRRGSTSSP